MSVGTLIIGAGLSGLALADSLHKSSKPFLLIEARDRVGGRILNESGYDLGPAWAWPHQPRIQQLASRFGLSWHEQYSDGLLIHQAADGSIRRDLNFAPMAGSLRLDQGLSALTENLAAALPETHIRLGSTVTRLHREEDGIIAIVKTPTGSGQIAADKVVIALPPRLAAESLRFDPALPKSTLTAMEAIPTWMAGHAKYVAIYDTPFWRALGFSGDAMSQIGPLVEIHDASPANGSQGALFGFIGTPAAVRAEHRDKLKEACLHQLVTLFGEDAASPKHQILKDWAEEPFTATKADQTPLGAHPDYGCPPELKQVWDGKLIFAGTELAEEEGGYLEGALTIAADISKSL